MFYAPSLSDVTHAFFTREGGVSPPPFDTLNIARKPGSCVNDNIANCHRAMEHLGCPSQQLVLLHQVHSAQVVHVKTPWGLYDPLTPQADAMVTQNPNIVLGVMTADCVPVLFHDPITHTIAAAHAGWRGAMQGVIAATLEAMEKGGCRIPNIRVGIGPCIHQKSYEVGADVYQQMTQELPLTLTRFKKQTPATYQMDLPGIVADCLIQAGVGEIAQVDYDTYTSPALFFSCRRAQHQAGPGFGCQLSAISLAVR